MKCAEYNINKAQGVRLFNAINLPNRVLPKGKKLDAQDIEDLKKAGIRRIFGAEEEIHDVSFQIALRQLCAKLCGEDTAYAIDDNGIAKIVAAKDGIFECLEERTAKFNRFSDFAILNTIEPFQDVHAGEIIAELQTEYPIIPQNEIDKILYSLSGNTSLLQITPHKSHRAALIYTHFYNNEEENARFTNTVQKLIADFGNLSIDFSTEYASAHHIQGIADTLSYAVNQPNDLIFIVPGVRSGSKYDVIRSALVSFVDEIVCSNIPQIGISDFIIATKRDKKIICLPYDYAEIESTLLQRLILQAIVSEKLLSFEFKHPHSPELASGMTLSIREQARLSGNGSHDKSKNSPDVAAIVLAAGSSRRAGGNKLLAELDGEPMFLKAVHAAVRSKAKPVYVITGYQNEEIEAALEDIDVNVLYNPAYRSGIKTSIMLGLNSLPSNCKGALLLPADMPNVTDKFLDKMIKNFKPEGGPQLLVSSFKGVKSNPVLWSKELFSKADIIPEEAAIRVIFPQYEDFTTKIETKDKNLLWDVTYPGDVETFSKKA